MFLWVIMWSVLHTTQLQEVKDCNNTNTWTCKDSTCIDLYKICDGVNNCQDESDEDEEMCLTSVCPYGRWKCANGLQCIPDYNRCDHFKTCNDNSDEEKAMCKNYTCPEFMFRCDTGDQCVLRHQFCNGEIGLNENGCFDYSDENDQSCDSCLIERPIKCWGTTRCASNAEFCNGGKISAAECDYNYCEQSIDGGSLKPFGENGTLRFPCQNKSPVHSEVCILPERNICNNISNCRYNADECFCKAQRLIDNFLNVHFYDKCWKCMDNKLIIPRSKVCDGIFDCADLSDECICQNMHKNINSTCDNIERDAVLEVVQKSHEQLIEQFWSQFYSGEKIEQFLCCNELKSSKKVNCNCTDMLDCSQFKLDRNIGPKWAFKCDGVATCEAGADECVNDITYEGSNCGHHFRYCENIITTNSLLSHRICDGNIDTVDDEVNCPHRFKCATTDREPINIASHKLCDGVADCFDQSDEMNCSSKTHFYCQAGAMNFISTKHICDNREDCDDTSDECQNCVIAPLSDDYKLISHPAIYTLLIISATISLVGNLTHIFLVLHDRQIWTTKSKPGKINITLVMSLALSDLLVGIYLWMLVGANEVLAAQGKYCLLDKVWRTGDFCKFMGVLIFIGSESSVMTLFQLGYQRYKAVSRPFAEQRMRWSFLSIVFTWSISILLAILPLVGSDEYFVTHVEYTTNPLMVKISKAENTRVVENLMEITRMNAISTKNKTITWDFMFEEMKLIHPDMKPVYKYHYYSTHGTCLPNLYPNPILDISYAYSCAIVMFNALCFLGIVYFYVMVYCHATRLRKKFANSANTVNANSRMQRKIAIIIATDFCCWTPIGVAALLSVAGVPVSNEMYAATATFILPVNSVINPLIYSNILDNIYTKLKRWIVGTEPKHENIILNTTSGRVAGCYRTSSKLNDRPME